MNAMKTLRVTVLGSLLLSSLALAQPARMMMPPALPAIETHLQQQRAAEQREAMDKPGAAVAPSGQVEQAKSPAPARKTPPKKKRKPAPSQP
ncbi:hypothetical protein [Denitratisoma oestradiolicum]|uniref:Uncharacterized protein n=1 Tax=Denitratisoma oestradiolicum TaxID=311182 RepID=A0A6S6XYS4_9PROT|nr:hypothetical protein [Denitratisoma oestradiolicum]TWO79575.1 hypothetical protein CBW56_14265 [Denitratisoma oestradiolicum]CAB1368029.1 conserved exported protein of unknown function [Denitratisoma oestradiolicum]